MPRTRIANGKPLLVVDLATILAVLRFATRFLFILVMEARECSSRASEGVSVESREQGRFGAGGGSRRTGDASPGHDEPVILLPPPVAPKNKTGGTCQVRCPKQALSTLETPTNQPTTGLKAPFIFPLLKEEKEKEKRRERKIQVFLRSPGLQRIHPPFGDSK